MTERPILFSAPMVRAILDGTKTQTRRLVKPKRPPDGHWMVETRGTRHELTHWDNDQADTSPIECPYGQPGDRLWVREAWARTTVGLGTEMVVYREGDNRTDYGGPWKPGIHMFRKDSRITLEITSVRVERLQDISADDSRAEGCPDRPRAGAEKASVDVLAKLWYHELWCAINGPESWAANPYVWVVEFTRTK